MNGIYHRDKFYAGIGARKTPKDVLAEMQGIAHTLFGMDYTLRSGGAVGADSAFENGSAGFKNIYLAKDATLKAMELAEQFHPNWSACKKFVKQLHGRNMQILFGQDLDSPVDFVVCWTPGGHAVGGTGQALRAAEFFDIPVINLAKGNFTPQIAFKLSEERTRLMQQIASGPLNRSNTR